MGNTLEKKNTFGTYLLDKGIITRSQLADALVFQCSINKSLMELALELNFISKREVCDIKELCNDFNTDFKKVALKEGYLNSDQLDEVLIEQIVSKRYLGELMVEMGIISQDILEEELVGFILIGQSTELYKIADNINNVKLDIVELVIDVSEQCLNRFEGIIVSDKSIQIDLKNYIELSKSEIVSSVSLIGDISVELSLLLSKTVIKNIVSDLKISKNIIADFITELIITIGGNLASLLSYMEFVTNLSPFQTNSMEEFQLYLSSKGNNAMIIEFNCNVGIIQLAVVLN